MDCKSRIYKDYFVISYGRSIFMIDWKITSKYLSNHIIYKITSPIGSEGKANVWSKQAPYVYGSQWSRDADLHHYLSLNGRHFNSFFSLIEYNKQYHVWELSLGKSWTWDPLLTHKYRVCYFLHGNDNKWIWVIHITIRLIQLL